MPPWKDAQHMHSSFKKWLPLVLLISACATHPVSVPVAPSIPQISAEPVDRAPKFSSYRSFLALSTEDLAKEKFSEAPLERWRKHTLALRLIETAKEKDSCPYWQELSNDGSYPLKKVAFLQSYT